MSSLRKRRRLVRFSKTRKRYERQGLLVEPVALQEAEREIAAERRKRK
jgi:hypothetical protein